MPLTLIKEDGTSRPDANSYASAADGDAYHQAHLYAAAWTSASTATKEAALVMASRLIDTCYQFHGAKSSAAQALQWPRWQVPDPDAAAAAVDPLHPIGAGFIESNKVPKPVLDATCELARELIKADPTDDPDGEGLRRLEVARDISLEFDPKDRKPIISHLAQLALRKYGAYLPNTSRAVTLVRV